MSGIKLWPPARIFARRRVHEVTPASSSVAGAKYSKFAVSSSLMLG
jgi:hypothetical protein